MAVPRYDARWSGRWSSGRSGDATLTGPSPMLAGNDGGPQSRQRNVCHNRTDDQGGGGVVRFVATSDTCAMDRMGVDQDESPGPTSDPPAEDLRNDDVESVIAATRVLVAVTAESVARVEDEVSLSQLRVLVMVASRPSMNLGGIAMGLGVHPSGATRAVDRLVGAGLLDRRDDPTDRRNLQLQLTAAGQELVERVMGDRRAAITKILERMPPSRRRALVPVLRSFAQAAGEMAEDAVWSLGWPTR